MSYKGPEKVRWEAIEAKGRVTLLPEEFANVFSTMSYETVR